MSRPCALCGDPCLRMSDDHAQPNTLLEVGGKVVVVHRSCKRRATASAHAARERVKP